MKALYTPHIIGALLGLFYPNTTKPQQHDHKLPDNCIISENERKRRIELDFNQSPQAVVDKLTFYFPDITAEKIDKWERSGALEYQIIDGQKKYFHSAVNNLFRIDTEAYQHKVKKDGPLKVEGYKTANTTHLPEIIKEYYQGDTHLLQSKKMRVTYRITVPAVNTQIGDTLRCWLPYPQENNHRQTSVKLLSTSEGTWTIAPQTAKQRSIYSEKVVTSKEETVFEISFQLTTNAEYTKLDAIKSTTISKNHTAYISERAPHILFTPEIRALSKQIVGRERNPLHIVQKIFSYISDHIPWASAREYSTIRQIPNYVIKNKHGDCGQVSLLFITLCRLNGIPAKWQSGFMLHPQGVNLHDWAEIHLNDQWIPVDPSFGKTQYLGKDSLFYCGGIDSYRMIINEDFSQPLYPTKKYPRSETVDFQRGELENQYRNLYFNEWKWNIKVEYLE